MVEVELEVLEDTAAQVVMGVMAEAYQDKLVVPVKVAVAAVLEVVRALG
tara:strand:- start:16 stop:162 length:147 start_codon:yes stop_codon:yes gene_type:complete